MPKEIEKIKTLYGISPEATCEKIHDGTDNAVYVISDKGNRFVLRESKRINDPNKDLQFELDLLKNLANKGASTPKIILTNTGEPLIFINNTEYTLFHFVEGFGISEPTQELLKREVIRTGGKALGTLHQHTQKLDLGEKKGRHIFTEIERFENLNKECQKRFSDYEEAAGYIAQFSKEAREKIKDKKLLSGVIHNDYRIQNLIFQSDVNCSIIDFDWACYGPLIKDVALAVGEWSYFDIKTGPSKEAIDQFLKGYNETAPQPIEYGSEY